MVSRVAPGVPVSGDCPPSILMVTTVDVTLSAFLAPLAKSLRASGWRVDAMARGATDSRSVAETFDGVIDMPWRRSVCSLLMYPLLASRVRKVVMAGGYDVVHVHTPVAGFVSRVALRRWALPVVVYTAHGFHFHRHGRPMSNALYLAAERLAGRWTDFLVVINREDEDAARRYRLVPEERLRFMPGIGVDTARYSPESVTADRVTAVRAELGLAADDMLVLMVAEFNAGKRHRDALEAFASLGRPQVHLAFAGGGPLMEAERRRAGRLGVAARVHFLGQREDVPILMRAASLVVLPSEREGLSRSVMEAMALRVPVVGSDARGVRDLLEGGHGLVVPVGDTVALAQAIARVLDRPRESEEMVRRARERVGEFSLERLVCLHHELYAEALQLRKNVEAGR